MTDQWVVLLDSGMRHAYGPIEGEAAAADFAAFLTKEVDPATWVKLQSPTAELLSWWRQQRGEDTAAERPMHWPPRPGSVWQDRDENRWICTANPHNTPYLVCLAKQADDAAEEIWQRHGPLTYVADIAPTQLEELPF
jgi:hypothetical protein